MTEINEPICEPMREDEWRQWTIACEVLDERDAQDLKWGGPTHDDGHDRADWLKFIRRQNDAALLEIIHQWPSQYRERLIKTAALAIAAIESLDRKAGK